MMVRLTPFLLIALLLMFIPKEKILGLQYRGHDAYIKAFIEAENDPTNIEKDKKKQLEYDRMTMPSEEFKYFHPEEE